MNEYIERENAIEWFMPYAHVGESIDADVVISDIKGMKAADVAPVRKGRWESVGISSLKCSDCGYLDDMKMYHRYCPDCGCFMR